MNAMFLEFKAFFVFSLRCFKRLIRSDLEIKETRNISERNRRFGTSCAIIKVT